MRLATYQPDIAPNLGAMIRICACFGVPMDIIEPCGFPLSIKALRRSAMDYGDIAEMTRHDSWDGFQAARASGRLVLLSTAANCDLWDFGFRPDDILMTGRESAGVPDAVHAVCDAHIRIPMPGGGRSLNVSVSAGIALAEALRQLRGAA
ncbi:MAG: tRNA (cytidine(34)-2'-O)-methyltransferase [Alphaproteobacteria bacterium]|nr:tRNA (cytidine(34)-2'-O)-methyltransferase [Alphaproteobacteria bacterium]